MDTEISVVIPAYNEEKNIPLLYNSLKKELEKIGKGYEIIFVNDGSTDNTQKVIDGIEDKKVRKLSFFKNNGLSYALQEGINITRGELVITLDADLQNDPRDIKTMLDNLDGYDAIVGFRKNREDSVFLKKIPSKIFNSMIGILFNKNIHDCSCTLKVMRKEAAKSIFLKKGYHRFIPILLLKNGFKLKEIKVNHNSRLYGKPKYNSPLRFFEGIKDIVLLRLKW